MTTREPCGSCSWGVRDNLGLSLTIYAPSKLAVLRRYREWADGMAEELGESGAAFIAALGEPRPVFLECCECTCGD